jgi:hypothetical protein
MADGDGVTIRRRACDSTDIDAAGCADTFSMIKG